MNLNPTQSAELRKVLLACNYMDQEGRQQLKSDLKKNYSGLTFSDAADPAIDIARIIDACFKYGGQECFSDFLMVLETYEGKESNTMKAVRAVWNDVIAPPVPVELRPTGGEGLGSGLRTAPPPDNASLEGCLLHWDREHVVDKFVEVVRQMREKDSIRVIGIRASPEAGAESLMQRHEAICDKLSRTPGFGPPIIYATIELRYNLPKHRIVTQVLTELARKAQSCATQLDAVIERIEDEWQRKRVQEPSSAALAAQFTECLTKVSAEYRAVILLHGFHNLDEDVETWVRERWLTRHAEDLQGVVVVLAGASGLDDFSRPPYIICHAPLPKLTVDQLLDWAQKGHKLKKVTRARVEWVNNHGIDGSPSKFWNCILSWKAEEELEQG